MILGAKLSWAEQIKNIKKRTETGLRVMRSVRGTRWGADPETLLMVYKGLIRSHLEYGAFLLQPIPNSRASGLDRIQYAAIRLAMGYMNSTPTNSMLAEAREPPLNIRRDFLESKCCIRRYRVEIDMCYPHL